MITSVPQLDIPAILIHQLGSFFPISDKEIECIIERLGGALLKVEKCFSSNPNKYYHRNGETYFNLFHAGQYTTFLYFISREVFLSGDSLCRMCMNSAIIGDCHIGDNVTIGAGALVKDEDIPSNSLVFGQSPNLIIKKKKE